MKRITVSLAVMAFFGVAIIGAFSGVPTWTCACRGLAAAVGTYVAARIATRIILNIIVDAAMRTGWQAREKKGGNR